MHTNLRMITEAEVKAQSKDTLERAARKKSSQTRQSSQAADVCLWKALWRSAFGQAWPSAQYVGCLTWLTVYICWVVKAWWMLLNSTEEILLLFLTLKKWTTEKALLLDSPTHTRTHTHALIFTDKPSPRYILNVCCKRAEHQRRFGFAETIFSWFRMQWICDRATLKLLMHAL